MNDSLEGYATRPTQEAPGASQFPSTQWSMVLRASTSSDTRARTALESLCRRYWQPLYTFVRRQGRDHHEAEDATQQFIAQLLAADSLQRAQPERGRFRTFLLTGLRNFLTSEWRRTHAAKRGNGFVPIQIGPASPDEPHLHDPHDTAPTPEQAFDRQWAVSLIDQAVQELRTEYERDGRGKVFAAMAPLIWGTEDAPALARHVAECGSNANAFTVALHRARRRLGDRLRALVAETVADPADIDAELRHLISAVIEQIPGK